MKKFMLLICALYSGSVFSENRCGNSNIFISKDHCEAHFHGQNHISIGEDVKDRIRVDNGSANAECHWRANTSRNNEKKVTAGLTCCIDDGSVQQYSSSNARVHVTRSGEIKTNCENATPSCIEGAMYCDSASVYVRCDHGTLVPSNCAPGTICKTTGPGTILCDFP